MPDSATQQNAAIPADFDQRLEQALLSGNACKEIDYYRARRMRAEQPDNESLVSLLVRLGMVSERTMAEVLAEVLGLALVKPADYPAQPLSPELVSQRFLKDQAVLPLGVEEGVVQLAMVDPSSEYPQAAIAMALDLPVAPRVAVGGELQAVVDKVYAAVAEEADPEDAAGEFNPDDVSSLRDMASEAPVIRLVNQAIQRAVDSRASDIHIEPFETQLKLRYRVDGVLRDEASPPLQMAPAIISRVKIMAGLDIAERRLPQDGRINLRIQGQDLDIRVSTVPTAFGESVVMRLLHREAVELDFDTLGFSDAQKARLQQALEMPHGMIIVTGPTGSGKTTTLYTALNSINNEERKVITVEDPVEYNMEGINQIQVNPSIGLSFAGALRSIVRQDPDVIMVGEMRDLETAKICVQSSLTGHLVLSTLHTNDSAGSVTRLLEMGIEDYLLNSTLNTVLAQRLVRRLCPLCKQAHEPSDLQVREYRMQQLRPGGDYQLHRPLGCEACGGTGFKGRVGIIEMLHMSDRIRELILAHAGAGKIEAAAREDGMRTMLEDGVLKALEGLTTLEEVVRVTQEA